MSDHPRPEAAPAPSDVPSAGDGDDSESSRSERGFFTRLIGAFSNPDGAEAAPPPTPDQPGIVNLRAKRVDDVAVPKVEITAVPVTIGRDDLVEMFRENGYSRIPVFKGTLDTPLGLIHLKDLALTHGFGSNGKKFNLRSMLRPLLYVPPSMPIGVLLQKMQAQRIHMALVIDEYGGVDGLVTLEDLVEQVIGEIEDEHDEAEDGLWKEEKPGQYLVQSRAPLEDFEAEIGFELDHGEDDEDIDTMGGLVFMLLGRVPVRGEVLPLASGVEIEVVDADLRRIKRLRLRIPEALRQPSAPAGDA